MVWIPKEPKYKPKPPKPNNTPTNTPTNTPMNRGEAIKVLRLMEYKYLIRTGSIFDTALEMAIEALQTGIVHCEECGWWQKQDDSLQGRCAKYEFYPTGRYFCAGGERSEE